MREDAAACRGLPGIASHLHSWYSPELLSRRYENVIDFANFTVEHIPEINGSRKFRIFTGIFWKSAGLTLKNGECVLGGGGYWRCSLGRGIGVSEKYILTFSRSRKKGSCSYTYVQGIIPFPENCGNLTRDLKLGYYRPLLVLFTCIKFLASLSL